MRIWWHRNARIYEGSPVEIVRQMQMQDMYKRNLSLGEFVDATVHEAEHWGFTLTVRGAGTGDRRAGKHPHTSSATAGQPHHVPATGQHLCA